MNQPSPIDLIQQRYGDHTFHPDFLWNSTLATLLSYHAESFGQ